MEFPEYHALVYLGHTHGIEIGVGKCAVVESFGGPVQKRGVYPDVMAHQQIRADKFEEPGQHVGQRGGFLELLRRDLVDQRGLGMVYVFRLHIVVKGFAQIDLQGTDPYRSNGDDLVLFPVQTGQLGIIDNVAVIRELSIAVEVPETFIVGLVSSARRADYGQQ